MNDPWLDPRTNKEVPAPKPHSIVDAIDAMLLAGIILVAACAYLLEPVLLVGLLGVSLIAIARAMNG